MAGNFSQLLPPPEAVKILIVLVLSFLIGLEREEHKADGDYSFGGVRTFPLIGLVGYAVALLSRDQLAAPLHWFRGGGCISLDVIPA